LHVAITARAAEAVSVLARGGADFEVAVPVRVPRFFSTLRARRTLNRRLVRDHGDENDDAKIEPHHGTRERAVRVNAFELAARSGDDRIVDAAFDIVRHRSTSSVFKKKAKAAGEAKNKTRERSLTSALFAAARVGDARAARRAAEALGDVSAKHPLSLERHDRAGGKTVLETAAGRGAAGVIRALLADQRSSGAGLAPREPGDGVNSAGAMAWAAYARSDEAVEAVLAAGVTAGDEWAAASRVAETRGASMRVRRVLRGRAGRGTA
jgi:hypothetical protein